MLTFDRLALFILHATSFNRFGAIDEYYTYVYESLLWGISSDLLLKFNLSVTLQGFRRLVLVL